MIKFVLPFLRYCTKGQLPAVHFRLEFSMSRLWLPANGLLIGLGVCEGEGESLS